LCTHGSAVSKHPSEISFGQATGRRIEELEKLQLQRGRSPRMFKCISNSVQLIGARAAYGLLHLAETSSAARNVKKRNVAHLHVEFEEIFCGSNNTAAANSNINDLGVPFRSENAVMRVIDLASEAHELLPKPSGESTGIGPPHRHPNQLQVL
jgi:hypothetical protein